MLLANVILAVVVHAHPLANEDVLEPSVRNEVDHALTLAEGAWHCAETNSLVSTNAVAFTNGFRDKSKTERAIALVSSQKEGRWFYRGEDVTPVAVRLLCDAADCPVPDRFARQR